MIFNPYKVLTGSEKIQRAKSRQLSRNQARDLSRNQVPGEWLTGPETHGAGSGSG